MIKLCPENTVHASGVPRLNRLWECVVDANLALSIRYCFGNVDGNNA